MLFSFIISECCLELEISATNIRLNNMIKGKYQYDQMHNGAPAYIRTTSPRMYLYWENNRWMMWKNLGQTFYCDPWWAFWNCREIYGWIRHDSHVQCPETINNQWKSGFTKRIDSSIRVQCSGDNTETTTTKPGES